MEHQKCFFVLLPFRDKVEFEASDPGLEDVLAHRNLEELRDFGGIDELGKTKIRRKEEEKSEEESLIRP